MYRKFLLYVAGCHALNLKPSLKPSLRGKGKYSKLGHEDAEEERNFDDDMENGIALGVLSTENDDLLAEAKQDDVVVVDLQADLDETLQHDSTLISSNGNGNGSSKTNTNNDNGDDNENVDSSCAIVKDLGSFGMPRFLVGFSSISHAIVFKKVLGFVMEGGATAMAALETANVHFLI